MDEPACAADMNPYEMDSNVPESGDDVDTEESGVDNRIKQTEKDFLPIEIFDYKNNKSKFILRLGSVGLFTLHKENFYVSAKSYSSSQKFELIFRDKEKIIESDAFMESVYDKKIIISAILDEYIKKYYQ